MATPFLLLLFVATALALSPLSRHAPKGLKGQDRVDWINAQGKWTAKLNPALQGEAVAKRLLGAQSPLKPSRERLAARRAKSHVVEDAGESDKVPKEFNAKEAWPECNETINRIPDQSYCGSCWAVAAAAVMSDRVCIHSGGNVTTQLSATDVMTCGVPGGGDGCQGGYEEWAFAFWESYGVVSGSGYEEDSGCKPYVFAPCSRHSDKYPDCPEDPYEAPACTKKCQPLYTTNSYQNDKVYAKHYDYFENEKQIQKEVLKNGPIWVAFLVYEDFMDYEGGIYEQLYGEVLGGHAVRLYGWGEENGKKFWHLANNWNTDWGEQGYFRMIRGQDECWIESLGIAAIPDLK